jgi:LPS-assembly lipoprotein
MSETTSRFSHCSPVKWLLGIVMCVALASCGFKLRGATPLPFTDLYTNFTDASLVGGDFKRIIRSQGTVNLLAAPEKAQLRLMILQDLRDRQIVGFSGTGRPREYQLIQKLRYKLLDSKADPIGDEVEIVIRRDVSTSEALINAKQQEEEQIYREMQGDLVQQLIRRLGAVNLNSSSQSSDANSRR